MELYEHQKDALERVRAFNKCAFYLDMGLGKTFVGAEKAMSFNEDTLVVCQKSKVADWKDHFFTCYIDKARCDESGAWCYDLTTASGLDMFFHSRYEIRIGIINYELLWRRQDLIREMNKRNFTLLLDESSIIQNTNAKWTKKGIMKLSPQNVILLSGTPCSGKYENLWSQAHLLGWRISEKVYNKQYINWIKTDYGDGFVKIVDKKNPYKNVDRLKSKLREHGAVFMTTGECFDLPKQTFVKQLVPITKEYRQFVKNNIVTMANGVELVGDTTLTKRLYARQLCGQCSEYKLNAFRDLVESTQDRLIVFYNFNEELHALRKIVAELKRPISEVSGQFKDLATYEQEDDSVTLVQYQAGAMGLNLQKANKIIYFTLPERSELFEQSKKRIHRIGQEQPCFYYILMAKGSVEESILQTLELRKDFTDELFREYTRRMV